MPSNRRSTRRSFLSGRSAVDALGDVVQGLVVPTNAAGAAPQARLVQYGRRAMACEFEILLPARAARGARAALDSLELIEQLEAQLTVFRDDSQIALINRLAGREEVPLDPPLFQLLQAAREISERTSGAFDITAAPLWRAWGFARREGRVPSAAEREAALARVGYRHLELEPRQSSVRFAHPELELNLGAIGKGYALDRAAEQLRASGEVNFLVHGGQSSVLAAGTMAAPAGETPPDAAERTSPAADGSATGSGADSPEADSPEADSPDVDANAWIVGLTHPLRPGVRLAEFRLRDRALGTSGSAVQFFRHAGRRYGHILDPRTGWPTEGVLSATVLAPSAALADALATAMYVLGAEAALDFARRQPDIAVLVITPGLREGSIELHAAGFRPGEFALVDGAESRRASEPKGV